MSNASFFEGLHTPTPVPQATPKAAPAPPAPTGRLPGLHLTGPQFAFGLEFAHTDGAHRPGAQDLLQCVYKAWKSAFPDAEPLGFPPILEQLREGTWRPSLQDLVAHDLTTAALAFMPKGLCTLRLHPNSEPVLVETTALEATIRQVQRLEMGERKAWLQTMELLQEAFPGIAVVDWEEAEPEEKRVMGTGKDWTSYVNREMEAA